MEQADFPPPPRRHLPQTYSSFVPLTGATLDPSFPPHLDPNLQNLANPATYPPPFPQALNGSVSQAQLRVTNAYTQANLPPVSQTPSQAAGRFALLNRQQPHTPVNHVTGQTYASLTDPVFDRLRQVNGLPHDSGAAVPGGGKDGHHLAGMRAVRHPPDLDRWRQRLFDVDDTVVLTEEQFQIYFPHVDNVYSHRSTQRYKRKPFISHYWDCRLKGRPPGTPKSNDPNKKKRKRSARERDLCDVKIKITEFFPGARALMSEGDVDFGEDNADGFLAPGQSFPGPGVQPQPFGVLTPVDGNTQGLPGGNGERYYTITRVNGSNGNGKNDGRPGPHKHTLEDSDRVKKNSIVRELLKEEKAQKKLSKNESGPGQKQYHKKATGAALATVKKHSRNHDLKLYGSCFCPFVQRVWIALEAKGIEYQYIEVDPYKKPQSLLDVNPKGLVPALRHGDWSCHESTVLLEYLEDLKPTAILLPSTPEQRAHSRLWADHVNRKIIPAFYHTLQAQEASKQADNARELREEIFKLVDAADPQGPFFLGEKLSFVDVQLAPWMLRLSRVLKPYRGWPDAEEGTRWARWIDAIEADAHVRATTSGDELYSDSYERYAENRPNTSQVANAVNAGRGLP